jgi:hypothetical protein
MGSNRLRIAFPDCVGGLSTSITGNIEGALSPNANPPCPNEFGNADGVNGYPSLWYVVIGTGARMFATTCDPATGWDTRLVIYKGNCDDMACVGSNDNGCGYTRSSLSWDSVEGATYHIQVTGWAIVYADWRFKLRVDGTDAPLTQTESEFLHLFSVRAFELCAPLKFFLSCFKFKSVLIHQRADRSRTGCSKDLAAV